MNNPEHVFDPSQAIMYNRQTKDRDEVEVNNATDSRYLFYLLNQPYKSPDVIYKAYDFINQGLKAAERDNLSLISQDYSEEKLVCLQATEIASLPEQLLTPDNQFACVNQAAAIVLTQPCWMQNISQISSSQTVIAVYMMSIYLQLNRAGQEAANLLESYQSLLLASDAKVPILHSISYGQKAEILTEMFDFASIQLALAMFPRVLFPEILGFTLAYCQMPTLIEICFPQHSLPGLFFKRRQQRVDNQLTPLITCIKEYLNLFPRQKNKLWQRIQNGFWLYHLQMLRCKEQFQTNLETRLSTQQAIAKQFQQKAGAAIGHHQKIQLQGKSLDKWFAGMPENSHQFMQALKQSDYIDSKKPADSRLLKLFEFKGPMFGVFDQSEHKLLKNWLEEDGLDTALISTVEEPDKPVSSTRKSVYLNSSKNFARSSNRKLYYYLINADLYPDVLPVVERKLQRLLQACSLFNTPPFKQYDHEKFAEFIKKIYQHEISSYQPLQGQPKISREAYIWGIEQIAPMILIDGCWLQNSLALQNNYPEICEILFSIYCDEIGNGRLEQNHPYIFQQLLDSLSIRVPPVHSETFVEHPGFINSAFDLPVYMLSLSSFSVEFLPELLGLNMAIELSGLGKGYMRLVDDWNYWGIDPTIAKIHISIDNYASGHTYLAKKAIQLYMDEVLQSTGNRAILDKHWRRIYTGYASLRFVGARFKFGLPVGYLNYKYRH